MSRQYRSPRSGGGTGGPSAAFVVAITPPTAISGSTGGIINLPNYGVTVLDTSGEYVLDAPVAGVVKRLLVTSATSINQIIVRASTGTAVKFNNDGATQIAFTAATTIDRSVELIGINSTRWAVVNVHPYTTDAATPSVATS